MLPYDLSEKYPATIMAIANSIANFSASITTTTASAILGERDTSYDRWSTLMFVISGANFIGASIFNLLVRAEPIDFGDYEGTPTVGQGEPKACVETKPPDYTTVIHLTVPEVATEPESNPAAVVDGKPKRSDARSGL